MNKMLDFIGKLEEVDTEGIAPLIHMTDDVNVLRADDAVSAITQKEALKNAPKKDSTILKFQKYLISNTSSIRQMQLLYFQI